MQHHKSRRTRIAVYDILSRISNKDKLDGTGVLMAILIGVTPAAIQAGYVLSPGMSFWVNAAILGLVALREVYQRRVEQEALHTPPPADEPTP